MKTGLKSGAGFFDYGLLIGLAALWGGSFTLIEFTVNDFPPAIMSALRLAIGGLIALMVAAYFGQRIAWNKRVFLLVAGIGLFGNAIPFYLIAWGQQVVDPGLASILMGIMPIATIVLAHFFTGDEPLSKWRMLGVMVGIGGLIILVGPAVLTRLGDDGVRQMAILGAAVSYGINAVITKKLVDQPRYAAVAALLLAGAILLLPMIFIFENNMSITPHFKSVVSIVFLAFFPTALAAFLMFVIIDRQGAGFFSQINFLVPVAGVFWAYIFLGDVLEPRSFFALITILSGVAIARIHTSKSAPVSKELST